MTSRKDQIMHGAFELKYAMSGVGKRGLGLEVCEHR